MNITPIANYFQTKKISHQKYATNNINFGMAKLDQVQLSKSKEEYYQKAREDYIGYFWTFHPEDEQYIPKLESAEADKEYFMENCSIQNMLDARDTQKYGVNKNQSFYQAANLNGYYSLEPKDRHLILDGIRSLPALQDGEQRRTVLSELAKTDIEGFRNFLANNLWNYKNPKTREAILQADTYLWDTLTDENKRFILGFMSEETELKLVAQEMEKLPDITSGTQSSILTAYAEADIIGREEFKKLISRVDDKTLLDWMKKDNVFVKKIYTSDVMKIISRIGVEEFEKLYGEKYGELFGSFFDNPSAKKYAIELFGPNNYKEQYEQQYGDWEKIKYESYLYDTKNETVGIDVLQALNSSRFNDLETKYQADFIIRLLNGEFKILPWWNYEVKSNSAKVRNIIEDYALNNEEVSLQDSIKILEGLSEKYARKMEACKANKARDNFSVYQDYIIKTQIAIEALKAQME